MSKFPLSSLGIRSLKSFCCVSGIWMRSYKHIIKLYKFNISDKWIISSRHIIQYPHHLYTQTHQIPTEIYITQPLEYNPITKHFYKWIIHPTIRQRKYKPHMITVYSQLTNLLYKKTRHGLQYII